MRRRQIRPNVYLPVVKFGVAASDWKFVLAATLIGYTIPFLLNLKLWRVPLELWGGLLSAALAIVFFNWARIGRRPYWLQHKIRAIFENPRQRRTLPSDEVKQPRRLWVVDNRRLTASASAKSKGV